MHAAALSDRGDFILRKPMTSTGLGTHLAPHVVEIAVISGDRVLKESFMKEFLTQAVIRRTICVSFTCRGPNHWRNGMLVPLPLVLLLCVGGISVAATGQTASPTIPVASHPPSVTPSIHRFEPDEQGVLSRTLFSAPGPQAITVTVREVLVGPRRTQKMAALSGPALVELFEGHGTIAIGNRPPQPIDNDFQVISADQIFVINNPNSRPIGIRLYVFAEK